MKGREECVRTDPGLHSVIHFHEAFGFAVGQAVSEHMTHGGSSVLSQLEEGCRSAAQALRGSEIVEEDLRVARAQLILEEVGELMDALRVGDEVSIADALGDLDYVVRGTFVTFGFPQQRIHAEIHHSNMTKDAGGHKPAKGARFKPPQLQRVLDAARAS